MCHWGLGRLRTRSLDGWMESATGDQHAKHASHRISSPNLLAFLERSSDSDSFNGYALTCLLIDSFFSHSHYSRSTPSSNSHSIISSHEQKRIDCRYHFFLRRCLSRSIASFPVCFPVVLSKTPCPWNLLVWLPLPITGLPFPLLYFLAVVSLSNSCTRLRANNNNEKP